ncbi:MAG: hypothetical protein H6834_05195 [Planctomycetes bacterium]|nr:hypothetical protein [Planctomycetota bacterium]
MSLRECLATVSTLVVFVTVVRLTGPDRFPAEAAPTEHVETRTSRPAPAPGSYVLEHPDATQAYRIDARFLEGPAKDDGEPSWRRLEGTLEVDWRNPGDQRVDQVLLHLYWNAFRNEASIHLRERGGWGDLPDLDDPGNWGFCELGSVAVRPGVDATFADLPLTAETLSYRNDDERHRPRFPVPIDPLAHDRTVAQLSLPQELSIAPGATATLRIEFVSQIPKARRRVGHGGDASFHAHWFPKLGVYARASDDRWKWNAHQFHASSEFFSDYSSYDVTLEVPARYESHPASPDLVAQLQKDFGALIDPERAILVGGVVATGHATPVEGSAHEGFHRVRFTQGLDGTPPVHEFVFGVDTECIRVPARFESEAWAAACAHCRAERVLMRAALAAYGGDEFQGEGEEVRARIDAELALAPVAIEYVLRPDHLHQLGRYDAATRHALFHYGVRYGAYDYGKLTVWDPPHRAPAHGGMEYPMFITGGTSWNSLAHSNRPESVTVHEFGHQIFYGIVGTNEFEAAFLDEGLNSYTDSQVQAAEYDKRATDRAGRGRTELALAGRRVFGDVDDAVQRGLRLEGFTLDGVIGGLLDELGFGEETTPFTIFPPHDLVQAWREGFGLGRLPMREDPRRRDRLGYVAQVPVDPMRRFAWHYRDEHSYRANSYRRPAAMLETLERLTSESDGRPLWLRARLRGYVQQYWRAHPGPGDLLAWLSSDGSTGVAGRPPAVPDPAQRNLRWFFAQVLEDTRVLAFRIASVAPDEHGDVRVVVERRGAFLAPLEIEAHFRGRDPERRTWEPYSLDVAGGEVTQERTFTLTFQGPFAELESIVLDPDEKLMLQDDRLDDAWFADDPSWAMRRSVVPCFLSVQALLLSMGGIG